MRIIDTKLGGTMPIDIIVKFKDQKQDKNEEKDEFDAEFDENKNDEKYWFSQHKIDVAKKVHSYLENKQFIGHTSSLATAIKIVENITKKPIDGLMLSILYEQIPTNYKAIVLNPYVSIRDNELRFSARTLDSDGSLRRDEFLKQLKFDLVTLLKNDNVEIGSIKMRITNEWRRDVLDVKCKIDFSFKVAFPAVITIGDAVRFIYKDEFGRECSNEIDGRYTNLRRMESTFEVRTADELVDVTFRIFEQLLKGE